MSLSGFQCQARTAYLRRKSQAARCGQGLEAGEEEQPAIGEKHLNLFPVEEAGEKKGNEEYLKEKKDEKVTLFVRFITTF